MAYSDFTLETVVEQYSLTLLPEALFADVTALTPPPWSEEALARGRRWPQETEKGTERVDRRPDPPGGAGPGPRRLHDPLRPEPQRRSGPGAERRVRLHPDPRRRCQ